MKYKLIIDKDAEEEVIAIVHSPSTLTRQIEDLVRSYSGADSIMGHRDDELRKLTFDEIEYTGFKKGSAESANEFAKNLEKHGIVATVRRRLGADVNAACGQLRRSSMQKNQDTTEV